MLGLILAGRPYRAIFFKNQQLDVAFTGFDCFAFMFIICPVSLLIVQQSHIVEYSLIRIVAA